jgi:tetratricopeptide (TPR) repeat protein
MSLLQLALLIAAGVIFYLFFKQLFSGNYPKRGVDFEANLPDEHIGGINRPDKTFKRETKRPDRIEELLRMADDAIKKGDLLDARKAVQSALILDENNIEALRREGYLLIEDEAYEEAKAVYERLLRIDPNDDLAHDSYANVLHRLGDNEAAIAHHKKAIALDDTYAPHYFNYANTLYDLQRYDEALKMYEKAFDLDSELEEAKRMIEELKEKK